MTLPASLRAIARNAIDSAILAESFFYPKKSSSGKRRILILRKDGLGDCILFYPFLNAYREYYKDAEITLVFPSYFRSLAPLLAGFDRVVWFDHGKFAGSLAYRRRFLLDLKLAGFDTAIYPVYTRESAGDLMMRLTGAPEVIGFDTGRQKPYTRLITVPPHVTSELERNAIFTKEVASTKVHVTFPTIDTDLLPSKQALDLLKEHSLTQSRYAIVFPGAGAPYKIWPQDRFATVIEHLARKDITPVVCGGPKERPLVQNIISLVPADTRKRVVDLSGRTDLPALAHLLRQSMFYFGSDTGILHLAAGVGTPTIAIVGSGSVGRFFPYGDAHLNRTLASAIVLPTGGSWDIGRFNPHTAHPSIVAIPLEQATEAIDVMIESRGKVSN